MKKLLLSGLLVGFIGFQNANAVIVGGEISLSYKVNKNCVNGGCEIKGSISFKDGGKVHTINGSGTLTEGDGGVFEGSDDRGIVSLGFKNLCGDGYLPIQINYSSFHGGAKLSKTYTWKCQGNEAMLVKKELTFTSPSGDILSAIEQPAFAVVSGSLSIINASQRSVMLSDLKNEGVEATSNLDLYIWRSAINEVLSEDTEYEDDEAVYEAWQRIQANPMKYFRKAFQGDYALFQKGQAYESQKDYENAIKFYKQACDLGNADACYKLGDIYMNYLPSCSNGAETYFCLNFEWKTNKKVYEYALTSANAYEKACVLECMKPNKDCKVEFSVGSCSRALKIYQKIDTKKFISLAETFIRQGKELEDSTYMDLAYAYQKTGDKDKAIEYGEKACEKATSYCSWVGGIYLDYGDYQKAYEKTMQSCNNGCSLCCDKAEKIKNKYGL